MNAESLAECRGVPAGNRLRTHRTDIQKPTIYPQHFPPEVGSWGYNYGLQKKNGADLMCGCGEMLICIARPVSGTGNGAPQVWSLWTAQRLKKVRKGDIWGSCYSRRPFLFPKCFLSWYMRSPSTGRRNLSRILPTGTWYHLWRHQHRLTRTRLFCVELVVALSLIAHANSLLESAFDMEPLMVLPVP